MDSKNMNYIFNVEYFRGIFSKIQGIKFDERAETLLKERNAEIVNFQFMAQSNPLADCEIMDGYTAFSLYTLYPGLLVGVGNPHNIAVKGGLKFGFTFDYVTGLPFITGSTLKGVIRSYFPGERKDKTTDAEYASLIKGLLGKEDIDVEALKQNMFENNDIFLGAFPVIGEKAKSLMEMEFVTPHREKFKNPNPISLIKVKPAVEFTFSFIFSDYTVDGETVVSREEKSALCKQLLLLMGIGAKTNVGFGRFSEKRPTMHKLVCRSAASPIAKTPQREQTDAPLCSKCGKHRVSFNIKMKKYNKICQECFQAGNSKRK